MTHDEKVSRLRELGAEVHHYQLEREWSDTRLCREISHVGSTKTYKRILDAADDLTEMSVESQLEAYEAAVELINARRAKDQPPEKEYEDFSNVSEVKRAVALAVQEDSIARFVCVDGETGTGKDAAQNALLRSWPKITRKVECHGLWRDSLATPIGEILMALRGEDFKVPHFPVESRRMLMRELSGRRLILLINEGHEMGPRGLDLIKGMINETPCIPVLLCVPTLLSRLIKSGYEESKQLFGNRLCHRVHLSTPMPNEILLLFSRRKTPIVSKSVEETIGKVISTDAINFGNWRYVNKVWRRCYRFVSETGKPLDLEAFAAASAQVKRTFAIKEND